MRLDQLGQSVVDLLPDVGGHHRFERRGGNLEGEVARPAVAGIDDRALVARRTIRAGADQETRDRLDRLLGGRQADAQQSIVAERGQALERQRQMRAALVRRQRMDLVDDHGPRGREHRAAGIGAEQDVERLRRGDDDVRRAAAHALALAARRVAGAHPGPDLHVRQALRAQGLADAGKRRFQVALDVVRERLQRRDVDDLRLVRQPALQALAAAGRRSRRERRRASCRIRSAPRSGYAGRPGSPATPAPAPPSAQRSCDRTRRRPPGETGRLAFTGQDRRRDQQIQDSAVPEGRQWGSTGT